MPRVTIQVLAQTLGISKASVSYALNGQPGVSEATRQRVLLLATELGWHPSSSARALSLSRADAIGIVLKRDPELLGAEPYYMSLLGGIEDVLSRASQSLLLRMVGTRGGDLEVYRQWSAERRVDGVIVLDLAIDDPRPSLLGELEMPFVLHGVYADGVTGLSRIEDQANDAKTIVEHLASLGHRHIAHMTGPLLLSHELDRRSAIASECAARGIRVTFFECDYTMETAHRIAAAMLRTGEVATAIVASNDVMALGVASALRHAERQDVALISWDDSMICQIATPTVTALERHVDDQGRRSARVLLDRLAGREPESDVSPASVLHVRETSLRPVRERDAVDTGK
ncbi:LacI family DNA-binding transcriptional regulator [Leifsonia poae]|uniref:LacI family DNA-binding transcriptional regulator n=1 Tax=Leifsonia poae TaxID=110933 RepID=UPI001CBCD156|nr:LacI family DNA-binding transcriptional regulator [Leifsonia poae]